VAFWSWRRGTGATATSGTSAVAIVPELAPIELYTADARIVAWLAPHGQRVTDVLNSSTELRLWRPSPGPLEGILPADGGGGEGEWQSLPTDSVILAMPPEWRASRQLRLHRRLRRIALTAGPFNVTGNVHLPPGVEPGQHLLRSQRFLPLTDGYVLHTGEPPFEHVVSVVIVNSAHVGQLVPLISLG
jgi:hypothetical protein